MGACGWLCAGLFHWCWLGLSFGGVVVIMKTNIRVEQYQVSADAVSYGAIKWLTKWDVKIQFSDQDTAYRWRDRIEKIMQGKESQNTWIGLTEWEREAIALECGAMSADWLVFMKAVENALKEKNA